MKRNDKKFNIGFYFKALISMLSTPGRFFREFPDDPGLQRPFGFLLFSSLFFTGATLIQTNENFIIMTGILMLNALVMPLITAAIAFITMTMIVDKRMTFSKLFSVFAFSGGTTMLISWIPLFLWITEPWRWTLIFIGLSKGCGLRHMQTILIIVVTFSLMVLSFCFLFQLLPI